MSRRPTSRSKSSLAYAGARRENPNDAADALREVIQAVVSTLCLELLFRTPVAGLGDVLNADFREAKLDDNSRWSSVDDLKAVIGQPGYPRRRSFHSLTACAPHPD